MTSFLNSIGKRKKSPEQLVISSKQALQTIIDAANTKEEEKIAATESLGKCLVEIKNVLYGSVDVPEVDEEKAGEISKYMQSDGLIALLIANLDVISFEARKDTALIFNNLVRKNICNFSQYLTDNAAIVERLLQGYMSADSALSCGSMIREVIRHESQSRFILQSDLLWAFFETYVHLPNFEIASDAFNTLRELLTMPKHKHVVQEFMETHCDKLLEKYDTLLQSDNYVTRRRSLKLLSEILLDRSNYTVMMRYISSKHNLKTIMTLLRHKSPQIQFETFHVFKIFVANPSKTPEIESIMCMNKVKLIAYLESFHTDNEDPQFVDEKRLLIDTLQQLVEPAVEPSRRSTSGEGQTSPNHHHHHHKESHSPSSHHHHSSGSRTSSKASSKTSSKANSRSNSHHAAEAIIVDLLTGLPFDQDQETQESQERQQRHEGQNSTRNAGGIAQELQTKAALDSAGTTMESTTAPPNSDTSTILTDDQLVGNTCRGQPRKPTPVHPCGDDAVGATPSASALQLAAYAVFAELYRVAAVLDGKDAERAYATAFRAEDMNYVLTSDSGKRFLTESLAIFESQLVAPRLSPRAVQGLQVLRSVIGR